MPHNAGMNWREIIKELRENGLSQVEIARVCGCDQSTISDLERGVAKDPRHALGERIRAMHRKHCKKSKAAA